MKLLQSADHPKTQMTLLDKKQKIKVRTIKGAAMWDARFLGLLKEIDRMEESLAQMGGCSDGNCSIRQPSASGSCSCSRDHNKMGWAMRTIAIYREKVKAILTSDPVVWIICRNPVAGGGYLVDADHAKDDRLYTGDMNAAHMFISEPEAIATCLGNEFAVSFKV